MNTFSVNGILHCTNHVTGETMTVVAYKAKYAAYFKGFAEIRKGLR